MPWGVRVIGRLVTLRPWADLTPLSAEQRGGGLTQLRPNQTLGWVAPYLIVQFRYPTMVSDVITSVQSFCGTGEEPSRSPSKKPCLDGFAAAPEHWNSMPVRPTGPWPSWFARGGNPRFSPTFKQGIRSGTRTRRHLCTIIWLVAVSLSPSMPSTSPARNWNSLEEGLRRCIPGLKQRFHHLPDAALFAGGRSGDVAHHRLP